MKNRICPICKDPYRPRFSTLQATCEKIPCAIAWGRKVREKKEKKEKKAFRMETVAMKEAAKTRPRLLDDAEKAFRRFIRARDRLYYKNRGELPTCISCGTQKVGIQYAAGHFKTKAAHPELRFNEKNCNLQCNKYCNEGLSGNIIGNKITHGYIEGIKIRFGEEEGQKIIDEMNSPHPIPKWSHDEIREMKEDFNRRALAIEKELRD